MKKILYSISVIFIVIMFIFGITYNNKEKNMLQDIINYQIKNENVYTPNSYCEYIVALNEAININDKIFASKEELNNAIYNLQNKIDNLYIKPDKTILEIKYEDAKKIDLNLYLPNSILNLENAIYNAYTIIRDDNVVIEDVNDAINRIDEAFKVLVIKPDKTILNDLVIKVQKLDKDTYTTMSYNILNNSILNAYSVIYNDNATQEQVDNAVSLINDNIDNLVVANKGVYKITYSAYMLSNNHVGNEWDYSIFYDGNEFKNGELITANIGSSIPINAEVYEYDKIIDYGSSSINLILEDGYEATTQVIVRENRGRYYGNTATWKVNCSVKLVEVIA